MKILLISPKTFGYEMAITQALIALGHEVDWFPHINAPNNLYKVLYRYFGNLMKYHYYRFLLSKINLEAEYEKIVIIKGEGVGKKILLKLKSLFPNAEFIFYNWDSFKNNPVSLCELHHYDKVKSFDDNDCIERSNIEHLPLFYSNEFKLDKSSKKDFQFFFAGTLHSDRFKLVNEIILKSGNSYKNYIYFYCQSKVLYYYQKIIKKNFKSISGLEIGFDVRSKEVLREMMLKSDCVIDIAHNQQVGLTMRTFEALGMKKKIITNNKSIINYEFYNENNIYVIGLSNVGLNEFMKSTYIDLSDEIYEKYDINNWVDRLIN